MTRHVLHGVGSQRSHMLHPGLYLFTLAVNTEIVFERQRNPDFQFADYSSRSKLSISRLFRLRQSLQRSLNVKVKWCILSTFIDYWIKQSLQRTMKCQK